MISLPGFVVVQGDALERLRLLPCGIAQCCVTSPPYFGLRDYGVEGQIGLEPSPDDYVAKLVSVFAEVRRVLRPDGTLWLNIGDSYNSGKLGGLGGSTLQGGQSNQAASRVNAKRQAPGLKHKDLIGIPWRLAFALQSDGWYLRQDIIWAKPNPMPAPVTDRCVSSHEYLFLLAKSKRYFFDHTAIQEQASGLIPGNKSGFSRPHRVSGGLGGGDNRQAVTGYVKRNKRSVWSVTPTPFKGAHFATMPQTLVEPCLLAGSSKGSLVIDPFNGAGTTGIVARELGRKYWGSELNPNYLEITRKRLVGCDT